ncbi:LysM peptidoglycan-binding domain-containing protein [Lachnospiraceae bacterium 54-53]
MKRRIIELSADNRNEQIVLPVNPEAFTFAESALNTKITLLNVGEVNLLGNRGLITGSLSSFFPSEKSPFFHYADLTPGEYLELLTKWKNSGSPIRVIVSDSDFNIMMSIDKLTQGYKEGSKDLDYTLELTEYRKLNVPAVKVSTVVNRPSGLESRPDTTTNGKTHTVVKGESLWAIAKKYYGNGAQFKKILEANRDKIKNQDLIYPGQVFVIP